MVFCAPKAAFQMGTTVALMPPLVSPCDSASRCASDCNSALACAIVTPGLSRANPKNMRHLRSFSR